MLKRYWLIIYPENRYSAKNIGVTAFSVNQAKALTKLELNRLGWCIAADKIDEAEVIENIDIRMLDQRHVIPYMGVVARLGVWFPNCNA